MTIPAYNTFELSFTAKKRWLWVKRPWPEQLAVDFRMLQSTLELAHDWRFPGRLDTATPSGHFGAQG